MSATRFNKSLQGEAVLEIVNGSPTRMDIVANGSKPAFISVLACDACEIGKYKGGSECDTRAPRRG